MMATRYRIPSASRTADVPFLPPLNPRISAGEYRALAAKPKRHKYGVGPVEQRTTQDGIVFASAAECRRYGQLKLLEKSGYIKKLELQPKFVFEVDGDPVFSYFADFSYREGMTQVIEDTKGFQTPVFRLKRKLIEAQHKIKIRLTK